MFVEHLSEVPEGAQLLYSAHGVSPEIRRVAAERKLRTIDATCPLVIKVHLEAVRYAKERFETIGKRFVRTEDPEVPLLTVELRGIAQERS